MRLSPLLPAVLASHGLLAAPTAPLHDEEHLNERQFAPGPDPTVTLSNPAATIVGRGRGYANPAPIAIGVLESFKQIPIAQPPVGPLRLKPPVPLDPTVDMGTIDATTVAAAACPQQFKNIDVDIPGIPAFATDAIEAVLNSPLLNADALGGTEDCLTVNVQRPGGTQAGDDLPVLLWIFGGGFELGSTAMYDGANTVQKSVELGKPVVFVAVNYRVAGFGFLGGREILADGSANLGLLDQRLGMQWVQDHIRDFGGDPDKVTLWGESAGSISILDHLLAYNGNHTGASGQPLFRGAIMNSGSAIPSDPVDCPKAQAIYDQVVSHAGCAGTPDTLACLRGVPYETFLNASNSVPSLLSFSSVALSYLPRPDGTFLAASPEALLGSTAGGGAGAGGIAKVPFILGDQEDEGTLFALLTGNLSTTAELTSYLRTLFFTDPAADVDALVALYPDDPAAGSPFGTGADNELYPQFKRIAAIFGDTIFTLTRRVVLAATAARNPDVPSWSYLATYDRGTPYLGTTHGSDLIQVFYGIRDNYAAAATLNYFLNFAYNLDPNDGAGGAAPSSLTGAVPALIEWPRWSDGNTLVEFQADNFSYVQDDFRPEAFAFLSANASKLHV